jgi:hypothetical protein
MPMPDFTIDVRHAWGAISQHRVDEQNRQPLLDTLAQFDEHDQATLMTTALAGDPDQAPPRPCQDIRADFESKLARLIDVMGEGEAVRYVCITILNRLLALCRRDPPLDWTFETTYDDNPGDIAQIHRRVITESSKRVFYNRQFSRRELYKRFVSDCEWLFCSAYSEADSIRVAYYGEQPLRFH